MNAPLADIGAELQEARQAQQRSLEELAHVTLISARHLKALEEGREDELPEPFYVKSFIRKYAQALGMGGDDLARRYWDTRPLPEVDTRAATRKDREIQINWWLFPTIAGALCAGAVAAYAVLSLQQGRDARTLAARPAVSEPAAPAAASSLSASTATGNPGPGANVATDGAFAIAGSSFSSGIPGSASLSGLSGGAATASAGESAASSFVAGKKIVFQVRTDEESWVGITTDGREVQSDMVPKGANRTWTAQRSLAVRVGRPGAVWGRVGDAPMRLLGAKDDSVYKRVFVTSEGLRELAPHGARPATGPAAPQPAMPRPADPGVQHGPGQPIAHQTMARPAVPRPAVRPAAQHPVAQPAAKSAVQRPAVQRPAVQPVTQRPVVHPAVNASARRPAPKPAAAATRKPGPPKPAILMSPVPESAPAGDTIPSPTTDLSQSDQTEE